MNALSLLKLDALRSASGVRNRLKSENPLARLGVTLSIVWALFVFAAFFSVIVRSGHTSGSSLSGAEGGLNGHGASALLVALLLADAVRRGRSRTRVLFENWLMSSGVRESTLRARAAILLVSRSVALAWLPLLPVRGALSGSDVAVAHAFGWAFGAICAGEAVGRAWQGWPRYFRLAWSTLIVGVWCLGVALLFGFVGDRALLQGAVRPLVLAGLYSLTVWSLMRPPVHRESPLNPSRRVRWSAGISEQGHLRGIFARDVRVLASFARHDSLSILLITFLAGLPQARLFGRVVTTTAAEGLRSPAGVFLTLIQVALVATVIGEVLWEQDRPSTWAFYRSAGALRSVVLTRSTITIVAATLWYAVVTTPTSILIGTPSLVKHTLAMTVLCSLGGTAALGSALGAALGVSSAQSRAFRMGGVIGVAGLFFGLTGASETVLAVTAIGVLSCFLAAALALLSRADLGLQRL